MKGRRIEPYILFERSKALKKENLKQPNQNLLYDERYMSSRGLVQAVDKSIY